jgi:hypothetical protein
MASIEKELNAGDLWAKVWTQAGKVLLSPSQAVVSDPDSIDIQFSAVRELDINGTQLGKGGSVRHSYGSLVTRNFTLGALQHTAYGGVPCVKLPFETSLDAGSKIEAGLYVFKEDGVLNVSDGSGSLRVTNMTIKLEVRLVEWKWCGDPGMSCQNQVCIVLCVNSERTRARASERDCETARQRGRGAQRW